MQTRQFECRSWVDAPLHEGVGPTVAPRLCAGKSELVRCIDGLMDHELIFWNRQNPRLVEQRPSSAATELQTLCKMVRAGHAVDAFAAYRIIDDAGVTFSDFEKMVDSHP